MIERRNLLKSINMIIWLKNKLEMILFLKLIKIKKSYKIKLGKYNLEYRVYKLQDGTYNNGRITVEK